MHGFMFFKRPERIIGNKNVLHLLFFSFLIGVLDVISLFYLKIYIE